MKRIVRHGWYMRQVKGFIQIYSRQARDRIIKAGQKVLKQAGLEVLSSELFACVDELIKNAVKANYKYILLRELICDRFACILPEKTPDDNNEDIDDLIRMPERFDRIAEEILTINDISSAVREILNEESRLLTIKNRIYGENRHYHPEEKAIIKSLNTINRIRNDIKEHNIRIILRIQIDKHFIYIEVTTTAPILNRDINRIHEKREEQRHCRDEGREHDFFIENIDTSESRFGLGYAKIDVILNSWASGRGFRSRSYRQSIPLSCSPSPSTSSTNYSNHTCDQKNIHRGKGVMEAFFNNGILFGEETLNHLHIFAGPWLDAVMVAVTTAGNEIFYIIALPVIYWCVDKKIAINVGAAFLITMTLNDSVKFAFNNPRPDPGKLLPGIRELARHYAPGNPGFPSGHTQGSVAFWTPIAILSKNRTALALCAFMIIMVPYSRIYLGVHFLGDIVGGFVIGAISLAIVMPAIAAVGGRYRNVNEWIMISALLIIPFMVCITLHGNHIYATMGTISGFLSGALI
ncbi:MAG: phosphatase PAP2 family protein, partial [Chrysiogenales bacterium]